MTDDPQAPTQSEADFLAEARALYEYGRAVDLTDREEAENDYFFANASDKDKTQWDEIPKTARDNAFRPVLQWNRIPTYTQQVVNGGRENKPAIKITPGDKGTDETAELFQSRIRQIEYECDADVAWDTARDQQVGSGRACLRVSTEYVEGAFRQRLTLEAIENQFSVVWDPASKKYDRADAEWAFVVSLISQKQHRRDYGAESLISRSDFTKDDNPAPGWIAVGPKGEMVQVAEYWRKEFEPKVLCNVGTDPENPVPVWKENLTPELEPFVLEERIDQKPVIKQYIINGAEILRPDGGKGPQFREWIGTRIPLVPMWGRQAIVDGKRRTFSLIRNAKDPQRLVNLYVSNIAEQIAQMPKSPYMVAVGQIPANHEKHWENAANTPLGYLLFNRFDENMNDLGVPARIINEPPIQALTLGLQQAIEGIKAAMGIFDASLGARSNETTGIAIQRRQKQADVTNFHFPDNEARSRKAVGEIFVELIPLLDKTGDIVPVRHEDGKTAMVPIGKEYQHPKTGKMVTHILTAGDYGVSVSTGPSYTSQRQEAYDRDAALVQAQPDLMWVIGDQMFAADDTIGSEERAERMRKAINMKTPGLADDGPKQPIPPEVEQMVMGMKQELAETQAFAQNLLTEQRTKQAEFDHAKKLKELELDFKREELQMKSETTLVVAELKAGIDADIEQLRHEVARIDQERGIAAEREAQESAQRHAADMADQQHQQTLEQAQQAQQAQQEAQPQPEGQA